MFRFLCSALLWAVLLPPFLRWGRAQAEFQIDKMQHAVFNSPGSEAPVPPPVAITGITLLSIHNLVSRWIGVRGPKWVLSLLLGSLAGMAIYFNKRK
ncbi:MAG: hypothetical protein WDZ49_02605 [Litorilinea sp.]